MMAASVASSRGLMSRDMFPSPQSLVRAVAEVVREGDWSVAFYTPRQRPEQLCVAWSIVYSTLTNHSHFIQNWSRYNTIAIHDIHC